MNEFAKGHVVALGPDEGELFWQSPCQNILPLPLREGVGGGGWGRGLGGGDHWLIIVAGLDPAIHVYLAWTTPKITPLSELLNGKHGVSAEMAIRPEKAGWSNAETWLGMQAAYDLWQAKRRAGSIEVERYPAPATPASA